MSDRSPSTKPRSAPCVGIFFLVGRKLFIDSTAIDRAESYGDHLIHEGDHISFWGELLKSGDVDDEDYEEHPRGRVSYDRKSDQYTLLADKCILGRKSVVSKILARMNLPPNKMRAETDSHYRCFRCLRPRKVKQ